MSHNQEEKGVIINGIRWATRNVGAPGTFVENPEDYGEYYTWEEAKNACPKGWRLPTEKEIKSLCDAGSEWEPLNGVQGRFFGIAPYQIFLPVAGVRNEYDDSPHCVGEDSGYWSSVEYKIGASKFLAFGSDYVEVWWDSQLDGLSIRCVAEN